MRKDSIFDDHAWSDMQGRYPGVVARERLTAAKVRPPFRVAKLAPSQVPVAGPAQSDRQILVTSSPPKDAARSVSADDNSHQQ